MTFLKSNKLLLQSSIGQQDHDNEGNALQSTDSKTEVAETLSTHANGGSGTYFYEYFIV